MCAPSRLNSSATPRRCSAERRRRVPSEVPTRGDHAQRGPQRAGPRDPVEAGVTRHAATPAIALRARAARDRGMRRLSGQRVMLQNTILVASDRRP